jgi:two-component system, NarL family, sensor histidine kinase DesK
MREDAMSTALDKPEQPKKAFAYVWLAYTGFLFIEPLMEPNRNLWLGTLVVFALFLGIFTMYVRTTDAGQQRPTWAIVATFVLGLITFPWNGGASTFFVYTAAFIPFSVRSTTRVLLLFLGECLCIVGEHFLFPRGRFEINWPNTLIAMFLLLVIGGGNIFFAQQKRADCKLRMAHEEIEALAAVAERERIARDLHDVLGHTLSVITLKAELAGRLMATDPARAATEIAEVESTARRALAEVREAIGGYRARGLAAEIETARMALDAAGVTLVAEFPAETGNALTAGEETVLALAVREAVTNIVRHARAKTCRLRFVIQDGRRKLLVEDDGEHALVREGNGLRGMRERVESIGGQLSLKRERGTQLLIELPLRVEPAA